MLKAWTPLGSPSAMANYFLRVKIFARGKGNKATKAAAYRAGERIRHERTSAVYDYTSRTDVAHAEIVLPTEYAHRVDINWALDRSRSGMQRSMRGQTASMHRDCRPK
jgi:hypothetical protein